MKTHLPPLIAAALVSLLATTLLRAENYTFKAPFSRSSAFDPTGKISLENVNGNIEIRTWDKNEIRVEGEKSAQTAEELHQIELTIELSPSRAEIKVHLPKRTGGWFGNNTIRAAVRFTVTVPSGAILDEIRGVNSSIDIDGVRGAIDAGSVNGQVRARGVVGDARLHTVNGAIKADLASVGSPQHLSFETVNGTIQATLPKDASASVHCAVVNGHIRCDLPLETTAQVNRKNLTGILGTGGASLEAKTVNGSIHLEAR